MPDWRPVRPRYAAIAVQYRGTLKDLDEYPAEASARSNCPIADDAPTYEICILKSSGRTRRSE